MRVMHSPQLAHYPNGQTLPSPQQMDFTPGALLGSVSGALGLRAFVEEQGHTFVVTADHPDVASMVRMCDVVTINCPLHPETEHMFNDQLLAQMKRGAYLVNTARGKICDRDAIVRALESGQLAGYAGDVWFPQPALQDHPWRTMPHHGMTPHTSGTSLSAQARYAAGVREILECWFAGRPIREEYLIVDGGKLAGTGAHSYSAGNATEGADEAARFTTR